MKDPFHKEVIERLTRIETEAKGTHEQAKKTNARIYKLEESQHIQDRELDNLERDSKKLFGFVSKYEGEKHDQKVYDNKLKFLTVDRLLQVLQAVATASILFILFGKI